MTTKEQPWVCVKMSIMLGDADGWLRGTAVVPKSEWAKDKKKFTDHLKKINKESISQDDQNCGVYHVGPEAWKGTLCTAQEAGVLKKFLGEKTIDFMWPSDFVQDEDELEYTDEEE